MGALASSNISTEIGRLLSIYALYATTEAWREFYGVSSIVKRVRIVRPSLPDLAFALGINWNYRRGLQGKAII